MSDAEICAGCEHSIGMHFRSVDGRVRCLVTEHHVSTSGVIGLESTFRCDCVDHASKAAASRRAYAARKREPFEKLRDAWARERHKPITLGEKK